MLPWAIAALFSSPADSEITQPWKASFQVSKPILKQLSEKHLPWQLKNTISTIQLLKVSKYFFHLRLSLASCNHHLTTVANDPRNKNSLFVVYHQYWLCSNLKEWLLHLYTVSIASNEYNCFIFLPVDSPNSEL